MGNITVVLKGDNGHYLARCNNCVPGGAYPDSAFVHATDPAASCARWVLTHLDNGKYALQADSGKYLTRCNNCVPGGGDPDSATVHAASPGDGPFAQWTLQLQSNGKYTLQSDSGKYLARCRDCVPGGAYQDSAFVHTTDPGAAWAQWTIVLVP